MTNKEKIINQSDHLENVFLEILRNYKTDPISIA
jgi:hypothetical protein